MTVTTLTKDISLGAGLQLRGLLHCHLSGKYATAGRHGAGEGMEVLHLEPQAEGREQTHKAWLDLLRPASLPGVTHFTQQHHICSNKATPANSALPYESMGDAFSFKLPHPYFFPPFRPRGQATLNRVMQITGHP